MVGTGGKDKTACSNKTVDPIEVAENILEAPNDNDESEDEVVIPVERAEDDGREEMPGRVESENTTRVDYDGDHMLVTETNCDNKAEWEQNITGDDEIDGNIVPMWGEEGDVENIAHEVEANDDDVYAVGFTDNADGANEDNDDDVYEVGFIDNADEANEDDDDVYEVGFLANEDESNEDDSDEYEVGAEEDDGNEDEDNAKEATELARGDEMEAKAKEDGTEAKAKEDGTEARAKEDGTETKAKEDGTDAKAKECATEARAKEDGTEAKAKEEGTEAKKHDADKVEASLKNGKTPNKRIRKKRGSVGRRKKLESGDKPESSLNKKGKKKNVESKGLIFMCSSKTKDDCFQYKILGLPEGKKDIVGKIYDGMRLFLYDLNLKLMYGIYKAAGPGGYNIEPKAFKSKFPSQVRFTVLYDCLPLPEEKFKKVIKENYFTKNKFDCQLNSEQVRNLCTLFIESSKGHMSKKSRRPRKPEKPQSVRQEVSKRRRVVDDRHQEPRYRERPGKRPRHQPLPAPLSSTTPFYSYERPSDRVDHQYQYNPYRDRGNPPPVTRHDPYKHELDPYPVRDSLPYRDVRDTYPRRPVPDIDGQISYFERRDPYVDGRGLYLERRDLYSEPYSVSSYRRDPILDRRDSFRPEGVLESGYARASEFETRHRSDIGSRDLYVLGRERPLYVDAIYPGEYPSSSRGGGLSREYRL